MTLSHEVGKIGILERENAAILNESIKPLCLRTIREFRAALHDIGLQCPLYLAQNDGTVISEARATSYPVLTFASGTTNSIRGAAFLSGVQDALVVDVGGTSTDTGLLMKGFPREASSEVKVGGVRTNFRMTDVVSIGLGGGSYVSSVTSDGKPGVKVGPLSAGYKINSEALVFANPGDDLSARRLTATDVAVARGLVDVGNKQNVKQIDERLITGAMEKIRNMIATCIDQMRFSDKKVPMLLVGGGSIIVNRKWTFDGIAEIITPDNFDVANAVGAALSHISSIPDTVKRDELKTVGELHAGAVAPEWRVPDHVYQTLPEVGAQRTKQAITSTGTLLGEDSSITVQAPTIDPATGEWLVSQYDIECLAIGAGILGCGGGGSPHIAKLIALDALKQGKTIRIVNPARFLKTADPEIDLVTVVAFMGAPLVIPEKLISGNETSGALQCLQDVYSQGDYKDGTLQNAAGVDIQEREGLSYINYPRVKVSERVTPVGKKKIVAIMSVEIGGMNCLCPLITAADLGLPLLDCDGMGRAFPELQMFSPFIYGCKPYPSTMVDDKGQRVATLYADGPKTLENHFRECVTGMGCLAGVTLSVFNKTEVLTTTVQHSVSKAWRIGDAILKARSANQPAVQAVVDIEHGKLLITAKITDVLRETDGGFDKGKLVLEGIDDFAGKTVEIDVKNEYLLARDVGSHTVLACVPDLITLMDIDTAQPITSEEVRFGQRVAVVGLRVAPIMSTDVALEVVGPAAFGYQGLKYSPIGDYVDHQPVAPM